MRQITKQPTPSEKKCVFGKDWFWIKDYCEMFQKPLASDNVADKSEVFITWIRNPEMFFHDNSLIKQVNARKSNIYVKQLTLLIELAQSISSVLYQYISNNLLFFTSCVSKCEFPRLRKNVLVRPHFKSGSKLDIRNCKNLLLGPNIMPMILQRDIAKAFDTISLNSILL